MDLLAELDRQLSEANAAPSAQWDTSNIGQNNEGEDELRERYRAWKRDHAKLQAIQDAARAIDQKIDAAVQEDEFATRDLRAELENPSTPAERMVEVRVALNQAAVQLEQTIKDLQAQKNAASQELRILAIKATAGMLVENAFCKLGPTGERLKAIQRTLNILDPLLDTVRRRADEAERSLQAERDRRKRRENGYAVSGVWDIHELAEAAKLHGAVAAEFNTIARRLHDEADALREKRLSELRAN